MLQTARPLWMVAYLGVAAALMACPVDDDRNEPNDSPDEATELAVGDAVDGVVLLGDRDEEVVPLSVDLAPDAE